jgi:VanZ family protein
VERADRALLPLRYPKVWLLVAGVVSGSLVPAKVIAALDVNDKLEHAGAYFVLMTWFAGMYRRAYHAWIGLALVALGVALDLLQGLTATRSLDWHDMVANSVGVALGLGLATLWLEGWCQWLERRLLT